MSNVKLALCLGFWKETSGVASYPLESFNAFSPHFLSLAWVVLQVKSNRNKSGLSNLCTAVIAKLPGKNTSANDPMNIPCKQISIPAKSIETHQTKSRIANAK